MDIISFFLKIFNRPVHVAFKKEKTPDSVLIDSVKKPIKSYASKLTSEQINEFFKKAFERVQSEDKQKRKYLNDLLKRAHSASDHKLQKEKLEQQVDADSINCLYERSITEVEKRKK